MPYKIRMATVADLDILVPIFDAYRQFYRLPGDLGRARDFLRERFEHKQSAIFLAFERAAAVGFTQLYPSFSSGAMARIFILNDLYVTPEARGRGAGSALLQTAAEYGKDEGAIRLVLSTELTNKTAQAVYEKRGWTRDAVFCAYQFTL